MIVPYKGTAPALTDVMDGHISEPEPEDLSAGPRGYLVLEL
jgi:hypothetical protein